MQMKEFSFGVRCKLEIFPLRSGSGSRMAKSLDLLHDFSFSVQTCLSCCFFFFFFFFDAVCTWRNAVAKAGREKKKSRNSQTHYSEYRFLQRKNK